MSSERGAHEQTPSELRLSGSLVRCPFCHDDVQPAVDAWTACARCLARHHAACWSDAARCATCGHGEGLGNERKAVQRAARWRRLRPWVLPLVVTTAALGYALRSHHDRASMVDRFDGYVRTSFEQGLQAGRARQAVRLPLGLELVQTGHDWLVVRRVGGIVDAAVLGFDDRLTSVDGDVVITTDQGGRTWRAPLTRGRVYVVGRFGDMTVAPAWPKDVGGWLEENPDADLRELRAALLERPAAPAD